MEKQYMDYGQVVNSNEPNYSLRPTPIDYTKHGQVFYNTHRWEVDEVTGEGRYVSLPFFDKAFISFSYGGRRILDFGLNAVTANDRIDRLMPPPNEDYVTLYKMINGQYYWGSHYNAREMTLTLSTDGMTQAELDDFKYWFQPGEIRELILSLHPNRGILARVGEIPEISVLPFKREVVTTVNGKEIKVKVIEYKGNVQVKFVMDDPFWYAINDVLGKITYDKAGHGLLADHWIDANGKLQTTLDNDAYKVMLEDHIPTGSMVNGKINFANGFTLEEYNKRKYTLDERANNEVRIGNKFGAPVINDEDDIIYPLTGAVIGPLYRIAYKDGEVLTEIPGAWCKEGYDINDKGQIIVGSKQFVYPLKFIALKDYISVKAGTTFLYIGKQISGVVKIALYEKNGLLYSYTDDTVLLSFSSRSYEMTNDCYIRIACNIQLREWDEEDGIFSLSKILKCNLIIKNENEGLTIDKTTDVPYFYSGNALSYPTIKFSVPIKFDDEGYIITFNSDMGPTENKYNTLMLLGQFKHLLKLTNPGIFMAYNQVIDILHSDEEMDVPTMIQTLRDSIGHPAVRSWIINCINIYVNNFADESNNETILTVNAAMKKQLLKYMPYLFASQDEANISTLLDEPDVVKATSSLLTKDDLTFSVSDTLGTNTRLNFEINDMYILYVDKNHDEVKITANVKNNKASYYHWQYSNDGGVTWYFLFDDYDETNNRSGWKGANSKTLTKYKINENDDIFNLNTYFRCLVSNNVSYVGVDPRHFIRFKQMTDLTIARESDANITADQNSTCTLSWRLTGPYLTEYAAWMGGLTPEEQEAARKAYAPKVYYATRSNRNVWWEYNPYSTPSQDFGKQIGIVEEGSDWLIINNNIATFSFKVQENKNKQLRGVKFRLVANHPIDNDGPGEASDYSGTEYTVDVNRLEIDNPLIQLTVEHNNNTTTYSNKEVTNQPVVVYDFNNNLTIPPESMLTLTITEVQNVNKSKTVLLYENEDRSESPNNITNNSTSTMIKFLWNIGERDSLDWFNLDNTLKVVTSNYGEKREIIIGKFGYKSQADMDATISNRLNTLEDGQFKTSPSQSEIKINKIIGETVTFVARQENGTVPEALGVKVTYQIYSCKELKDNKFQFTTPLSDPIEISDPQAILNDQTFTININKITQAGYYACKITYQLQKSSDSTWTDPVDISPDNYFQIDVIPLIALSSPTSSLSNENYTYYTVDQKLYNDKTEVIISETNPITFTLSYLITNSEYIQYVKENGKSKPNIEWYLREESTMNPISGSKNLDRENAQVSCIISYSTLSDFASIIDKHFYCVVVDKFGNPRIGEDINIEISIELSREKILTKFISWKTKELKITKRWPVIIVDAKDITISSDSIEYTISYDTDKSNNLSKFYNLSGIPPTKTVGSGSSSEAQNSSAAMIDCSQLQQYLGNHKNAFNEKYTCYNSPFNVLGTIAKDNLLPNLNTLLISLTIGSSATTSGSFKYEISINNSSRELTVGETKTLNFIIDDFSKDLIIKFRVYYNALWPANIGFGTNLVFDPNKKYTPANFPKIPDLTYLKINYIKLKSSSTSLTSSQEANSPQELHLSSNFVSNHINNTMFFNNSLEQPQLTINHFCPVSLNCGTGEYTMQVKYNTIKWPNGILKPLTEGGSIKDKKLICYLSSLRHGESITSTESVGDMVLLNNFVFSLQNHFNPITNEISPWSETDKTACHKLTYDGDVPLQNFVLDYKNLYL